MVYGIRSLEGIRSPGARLTPHDDETGEEPDHLSPIFPAARSEQ